MKTKTKSFDDKAADFHDKEMPKAGSNYICFAVITIDSVLKKDENYYLKVFLKNVNTLKKKWLDLLLKIQVFFGWVFLRFLERKINHLYNFQ